MQRQTLPHWSQAPSIAIIDWNERVETIQYEYATHITELPKSRFPEIIPMRKKKGHDAENAGMSNGLLLNVDFFDYASGTLNLKLSNVHFFDYLTASQFFRYENSENPIRPLAVQATVLSADGERLFLKRRFNGPRSNDFPGKIDLFGGSMNPQITDPDAKIIELFQKKWGLTIHQEQVTRTGADWERVNNIICIFYVIRLTEEQETLFRSSRGDHLITPEQFLHEKGHEDHEVYTEIPQEAILRFMIGVETIHGWNPTAYTNMVYALAQGKMEWANINAIVDATHKRLEKQAFVYDV